MKKFKALLIICLIIALPIYTADVFAIPSLEVTSVSGEDGVQGYVTDYDKVIIEVDANVDNDEVTPDQVKVNGFDFTSCTAGLGGYDCRYTSPSYNIAPGEYDFTIDLYSDTGTVLRTTETSVRVDNLAPEISFDKDPVQSQNNVSVSFTVIDRASIDDYSRCSGLKRIEFWDGGEKLDEVGADGCSHTGSIILKAPSSGRITIKAYDEINNIATRTSQQVLIDSDHPEIFDETFTIRMNGVVVTDYMGGGENRIDVEVLIKDTSLSASNVILDLSALGGERIPATSCVKTYENYKCSWVNALISPEDTTASLTIIASDDFGNSDTKIISKTFKVDATAPVVTSIKTNRYFDKSYIGFRPVNITMTITEAGAGIDKDNIIVNFGDLGYGDLNPYECENMGNTWECRWTQFGTTKTGERPAVLYVIEGADNAGNALGGLSKESIYIDTVIPRFSTDPVVKAVAQEKRTGNFIVSGDDLEITISAYDNSPLEVYADFSAVLNEEGSERVVAECTGDKTRECKFNVGPLASGYRQGNIIFTAEDAAGNFAKWDYPITVFGKETDEVDYWGVGAIEAMPQALDRQTTPLIEQRVYNHVNLRGVGEILSMDLVDCTGGEGFIADHKLFNKGTDPYIMLELKKTTANVNDVKVECILDIVTLYDKKISSESEKIPLTIKFYNMPLGEASSQLEDKIDDLYDEYIDSWWKVIGFLDTTLGYAKVICNVVYTWRQVTALWATVKQALGMTEKVAPITSAYRVGACLKTEAVKEAGDTTFEFADKFCNIVNCRMARPEGNVKGLEKWGSMVGGGGLIDLNNWIGADIVSEFTGKTPIGGKWESSNEYGRYRGYMNAKDSLVLSLLTICVPGIIYNLQKYREIQCGYINCLEESTATGVPADACDKVKEYQTCKYLYGEIFQIIPFTAFYNYFVGMIKNALSDPFSIVGVALGATCAQLCTLPTDEPHDICIWSKIFAELGDIINNVQSFVDNWELVGESYCHQVEDRHEEKDEA